MSLWETVESLQLQAIVKWVNDLQAEVFLLKERIRELENRDKGCKQPSDH